MSETHDFDNTVLAILDREPAVRSAVQSLSDAGYEFEVIEGEKGKAHLDPRVEGGTMAAVRELISAFGDQQGLRDRLNAELDRGNQVLSVNATPDEADEAVRILRDHGGEYVWRFGTWAFTRIGD